MDGCVYSVLIGFSRERERDTPSVQVNVWGSLEVGGELEEGRTTTTNQRRPIDFE